MHGHLMAMEILKLTMVNWPLDPDPRKTLNRHDAKAAMDGMFGTFQSRTREPVLEAFRSSVCLPQ